MKIKLGKKVYHRDIENGQVQMEICGIREHEVELRYYIGGIDKTFAKPDYWFSVDRLLLKPFEHFKERRLVRITVFITKKRKFRARIATDDEPVYEVTIGGKEWRKGKGREFEERIIKICEKITTDINNNYHKIRNEDKN